MPDRSNNSDFCVKYVQSFIPHIKYKESSELSVFPTFMDYTVVFFINTPEREDFDRKHWPLHLTLVGTFQSTRRAADLVFDLSKLCDTTKPIVLSASSRRNFGKNHDIPAVKIKKTDKIQKLHDNIIEIFGSKIFIVHPEWSGSNYSPHVTDQETDGIYIGQKIHLSSASLVRITNSRCIVEYTQFLN